MIESHLAKESTIAFQLTAVAYCLRQLCPEVSFVFHLSSLISVNYSKKWRREKCVLGIPHPPVCPKKKNEPPFWGGGNTSIMLKTTFYAGSNVKINSSCSDIINDSLNFFMNLDKYDFFNSN